MYPARRQNQEHALNEWRQKDAVTPGKTSRIRARHQGFLLDMTSDHAPPTHAHTAHPKPAMLFREPCTSRLHCWMICTTARSGMDTPAAAAPASPPAPDPIAAPAAMPTMPVGSWAAAVWGLTSGCHATCRCPGRGVAAC
eukprot:1160643-Pelagomonas_calceolata.AAC.3